MQAEWKFGWPPPPLLLYFPLAERATTPGGVEAKGQLLPLWQRRHPFPHAEHDAIDTLEPGGWLVLTEQADLLVPFVLVRQE